MSLLYKRTLWKTKPELPSLSEASVIVFSEKTAEVLIGAGFDDSSILREMTDEDILAIKGIGPSRLSEIRAALSEDEE